MQSSTETTIFQSLATKLIDSGIGLNLTQKGRKRSCVVVSKLTHTDSSEYIDRNQSTLQITTLLLICLVALQLAITSASLRESNVSACEFVSFFFFFLA
jgi:hypothetical protein